MVGFVSNILAALLLSSGAVYATTWSPTKFGAAVAGTDVNNPRVYFYDGGTMQLLATSGSPATPASFNAYAVGENFGAATLGITNVSPDSNFAAVSYTSPSSGGFIRRAFYQATNGNIRSVWTPGGTSWAVDPTVIATGFPVGTPIASFYHRDSSNNQVIVVQYADENGFLTQRVSNTDAGNWTAPVTVTT